MAKPVVMTVQLTNPEAVHAFREGLALVREASQDAPWSDDLREAVLLLSQAAKELSVS